MARRMALRDLPRVFVMTVAVSVGSSRSRLRLLFDTACLYAASRQDESGVAFNELIQGSYHPVVQTDSLHFSLCRQLGSAIQEVSAR